MPSFIVDPPGQNHSLVGFHDGWLGGLRVTRKKALTIWCSTPDAAEFTLVFPNTVILRCSSFTGGNVINVIHVYGSAACPRHLYANASYLDAPEFSRALETRFESFKNTDAKLLELSTSDGCSILAVFDALLTSIQIIPTGGL